MLEAVAKAVIYSKSVTRFKLDGAEFVGGVYKIEVSGVSIPEKPFVKDIVGEHILCKDLVESVLERDSLTRDDDKLLLFDVWKAQGVEIDLDHIEIETMFNAESITRARRKIQNNEGKFPPTSYAVAKRRGINEDLLREHYGSQ